MASKTGEIVRKTHKFIKPGIFDKGLGALLPEAYRKFFKEWKQTTPTAVHYIPETEDWRRNDETGEVFRVPKVPLPLIYPVEAQGHLWGGEGIVQGFQVRAKMKRRVPHFWVPVLKRSVVYSEVLDKYIRLIVTGRTLQLINANYGFDHYILKTPACDLRSLVALGLKRKILQELEKGCPTYADRPDKQKDVLDQYKKYLSAYTSEEIQWYGLSLNQAMDKINKQLEEEESKKIVPLKRIYRAELIEKLKEISLSDASEDLDQLSKSGPAAWLQKINPFGKKQET